MIGGSERTGVGGVLSVITLAVKDHSRFATVAKAAPLEKSSRLGRRRRRVGNPSASTQNHGDKLF